MKSKVVCSLVILGLLFTMTACANNEIEESFEVKEELETVISPTCDILVSSDFMCDKPVGTGIYTEQEQWEKAIEGTDVEVVLERKDMYDDTFFEDNALLFTHNKILQSDKNRIIPKSTIDKANIATFTTKRLTNEREI